MVRRKRAKKRRRPESVFYEVLVDEWRVSFGFSVNQGKRDIFLDDFIESSYLYLSGRLLQPVLKNVTVAEVRVICEYRLDDYWKEPARDEPPNAVGVIALRLDSVLEFFVWVPSRQHNSMVAAATAGGIRLASFRGGKLRYRSGVVWDAHFMSEHEED